MFTNIEAERARLGLTKQDIGARLGVTAETYSAYVKERRPIPSDTLLAMVKLFDKSADYLLGLKND